MCSHLCTHFHVSNCKNEEYIRRKERDARTHSFLRESVMGVTKNPHGHPIKSVHVKIVGKVQGCYFRKWAREQAKYMTINGWIRNCKDGSVEAVFSGKSAAVDTMLEYCKTGPARARVDSMQVDVCDQPRGVGFKQLPDYNFGTMKSIQRCLIPCPNKLHSCTVGRKEQEVVLLLRYPWVPSSIDDWSEICGRFWMSRVSIGKRKSSHGTIITDKVSVEHPYPT